MKSIRKNQTFAITLVTLIALGVACAVRGANRLDDDGAGGGAEMFQQVGKVSRVQTFK